MPLPSLGYKHWEIWLYYSKDNHDKTPDVSDAPGWTNVTDLALPLRLVKPGRVSTKCRLLSVFPEKLLVTARFAIDMVGGVGYIGYFIGDEVEPRLILETTSLSYVNLNGIVDISDVFPRSSAVEMADLYVKYQPAVVPGTAIYLACHQIYYCVRR